VVITKALDPDTFFQQASAARRSLLRGMTLPERPFEAEFGKWIASDSFPSASVTIAHWRAAIILKDERY